MADSTTLLTMTPRPLTAGPSGVSSVGVIPQESWVPQFVLETNFATGASVSGTALAAAGDIWNVNVAPPSAMPGYLFLCVAMRATSVTSTASAAAQALWADTAAYSVQPPESNLTWVWDSCDMLAARDVWDGTAVRTIRNVSPTFRGVPARPGTARSGVLANNSQGGFQLTVGTWDAGAAALTTLHVDARFLAFPAVLENNVGLYLPRMYFQPN